MSPTNQARGDKGKEPKLHRWQNGEIKLGRNQARSGGQFPSGQMNQQFVPTAAVRLARLSEALRKHWSMANIEQWFSVFFDSKVPHSPQQYLKGLYP